MHITFGILAHSQPDLVIRLINRLAIGDDISIVLHWDKNSSDEDLRRIQSQTKEKIDIILAERVHCAWGEWSLVQAQLNMIEAVKNSPLKTDYFYLLSGVDYPIRPIAELRGFLERNRGKQFIEAANIRTEKWITDGLAHQRYQYRFYFNFQKQRKLWELNYKLQKAFIPRRKSLPDDLVPHMGSQWSCLSWDICLKVLEYSKNATVKKFYKSVWIPDEMFFPSFVAHMIDKKDIVGKSLTFYQFIKSKGIPFVFYNDHFDFLIHQPAFFARKISNHAIQLREQLDTLEDNPGLCFSFDDKDFYYKSNFLEEYEKNNHTIALNENRLGLVKHNSWGQMDENDHIYFIVTGANTQDCIEVANWINENYGDNFICHNELFNPKRIGFINNADSFAGYDAEDNAIPQGFSMDFLAMVMQNKPHHITGFIYTRSSEINISNLIKHDPFCFIIHIANDSVNEQNFDSMNPLSSILEENPYIALPKESMESKLSSYVMEDKNLIHRSYWTSKGLYKQELPIFITQLKTLSNRKKG